MAIEMAIKVDTLIHRCFVCCRPGGRQGDTERVVARWRRPVASSVALDMLHRAMPHLLLQRLTMAINGLQRRVICSLPPPILLGIIIAKDHVMVH